MLLQTQIQELEAEQAQLLKDAEDIDRLISELHADLSGKMNEHNETRKRLMVAHPHRLACEWLIDNNVALAEYCATKGAVDAKIDTEYLSEELQILFFYFETFVVCLTEKDLVKDIREITVLELEKELYYNCFMALKNHSETQLNDLDYQYFAECCNGFCQLYFV